MSIDNKKWQNIAKKYDSKAKWADALLTLNFEDHDDLLSALIELDPKEIAGGGGSPLSDFILNIDISKLPDPPEMVSIINRELGRDRPSK